MPHQAVQKQLLLVNANKERLAPLKKLLLEGVNFKLFTADNAKDAVEILKTESIHFVVSNMRFCSRLLLCAKSGS